MPFDERAAVPGNPSLSPSSPPRRRIAVIGAGVSGLSAAWLLSKAHDVTLYERDRRLGGHANTVDVDLGDETVPVDAGFIVYNEPNYPNLTALFEHLGVASEETCMSFGASMRDGEIEYSGQTLSSVFANRRNAVSPSYWRMLADIVRFHKDAKKHLVNGAAAKQSLNEFVAARGYSQAFVRDFLEPMASAIWSTPSSDILDYPAETFFRFFDNHGLLQVLNLPVWRTVSGGSRTYVDKISVPLAAKARLGVRVVSVERVSAGVEVRSDDGATDRFDDVVIAAHADRALAMLAAPTPREEITLGAFNYQQNLAVMHVDRRHMPKRRRAWSSWNYIGGAGEDEAAAVTYWMNRLQNLTCEKDIFVTINPQRDIDPAKIIASFDYDHPVFNLAAGAAQRELWSLQGEGGVWYCGAHFGQGFHEDGLQAGLAVAEAIGGVRRPWRVENESGRIFLPQRATRASLVAMMAAE